MSGKLSHNEDAEVFAVDALSVIQKENITELISIIQKLNNCYEKELVKVQKFTECCLKEVLNKLGTDNVSFVYLLWSSLNLMLHSPIAQKYIYRHNNSLAQLKKSILIASKNNNDKLLKASTDFLSAILVGAPETYFEKVCNLILIEDLVTILDSNSRFSEESFKSIVCCIGLLCDGTRECKKQLIDRKVADVVYRIGEKYAVDEDFSELAALTYDDLVSLNVDDEPMGKLKFIKSQIEEVIFCSNPQCSLLQKNLKYKKCSQCKLTVYCSKNCQVTHWKNRHHELCTV